MALPKLTLVPQSSNYAVKFGNGVVVTKLDGGRSRYRTDIANPSNIVTCTWLLDPTDYASIVTFFKTTLANVSLPFLIDLVIDTATPSEYQANVVPDTLQLSSQSGNSYVVSCTLEAYPAL